MPIVLFMIIEDITVFQVADAQLADAMPCWCFIAYHLEGHQEDRVHFRHTPTASHQRSWRSKHQPVNQFIQVSSRTLRVQ